MEKKVVVLLILGILAVSVVGFSLLNSSDGGISGAVVDESSEIDGSVVKSSNERYDCVDNDAQVGFDESIKVSSSAVETDSNNPDKPKTIVDNCWGERKNDGKKGLREAFCKDDGRIFVNKVKCAGSSFCYDGACVEEIPVVDEEEILLSPPVVEEPEENLKGALTNKIRIYSSDNILWYCGPDNKGNWDCSLK